MRILVAGVVVLVVLLGVGCGGESPKKDDSAEKPQETKQDNAGTVEETTAPRERTETTTGFEFSVGRTPMDEEDDEELPEDVLALQYEYINVGVFEEAYLLFDERSKQEVSLERYRAFFEENAPYSVTDYSFSPPEIEGDSASVDVAFTVTSASGVERLERTQEFVREDGDWRVVMRSDQVSAFTATDEEAEAESESQESETQEMECRPFTQSEFATASPKLKAFIRECDRELSKVVGSPQPVPNPPAAPPGSQPKAPPVGGDCPGNAPIKGNVSSSGELIYHVPGGEFYDRTNAEECFATESDAQAAEYRRSQR